MRRNKLAMYASLGEGGIVFIQVTSQNKRATLYFPVSEDEHTDI